MSETTGDKVSEPGRACSIEGCERKFYGRGWCSAHYQRWWATGSVNPSKPVRDPSFSDEEWFWSKVDATGDCWIWTRATNKHGYGCARHQGQRQLAHRTAYELLVGPIPDGLEPDHLCRNSPCVNPDHIELVTHRTNSLRGYSPPARNARKTHCLRGHPFSGDNLRITPTGGRVCRACHRIAERLRVRKAKASAR